MDIDKLTELAQNIMQVDGTERRYKAVGNLQQKIVEDIGSVISACTDLVRENATLRFSDMRNILWMYGAYDIPYKCIYLLTERLGDVEEYEQDTEGKRAERKQKLKEYQQTVSIQLPPQKVIHHVREGRTEVIRDVHPDLIYCQHGTYREYSEVCNTFEYRLCRKIQKSGRGNLKTLFQKVCLYIALKNERAMMKEELLLLGVYVPADEVATGKQEEATLQEPGELDTERARKAFQRAIEAGFMKRTEKGYKWLYGERRGNVRLAYFLQCVFNADGCSQVSYSKFESLFEVNNLAQSTNQMLNAKNPQKWREEILKIIPKHS